MVCKNEQGILNYFRRFVLFRRLGSFQLGQILGGICIEFFNAIFAAETHLRALVVDDDWLTHIATKLLTRNHAGLQGIGVGSLGNSAKGKQSEEGE